MAARARGDLQQQRPPPPKFEAQVGRSKRSGLLVAGLQLVSRFLGFCALTWATVVLLGGFASALRLLDFYLISALLLLEGARLFIVQVFCKLLSRALFRELHRPEDFKFTDRQPSKALRLDLMGQALSLILATASLASTSVRFALSAHGHALSERVPPDDGHSNLPTSLRIFYILVICNAAFAIASSLSRPLFRQRCHGSRAVCSFFRGSSSAPNSIEQDSLMCFHDEVYKTAMEEGLPEADQLDILDFAFRKLASDYKRNIRPPLIKELNKDLICYLYKGNHGIAMACEYLKGAGDVWEQIAAANLPGLWVGEDRIESQMALFWALRQRMYGAGKDAESALNSIECLGRAWAQASRNRKMEFKPYPFLVNDPAANTNVVDTLVDLILEPIRPTLLFQVRAFEACCRHPQVLRHLYREEEQQQDREEEEAEEEGGKLRARRHLYREEEKPGDTALCEGLQARILANEVAQRGLEGQRPLVVDAGWKKLQMLCCRLQSIVAGRAGDTWTASNIYAGNALVTLLCYDGRQQLGQEIKQCFADTVEERIDPARPNRAGGAAEGLPYFWNSDLEAVERLRFRLGLQPYPKWPNVRLIHVDGTVLSDPRPPVNIYNRQAVNDIITRARSPLTPADLANPAVE